jgi:hypothetical protein
MYQTSIIAIADQNPPDKLMPNLLYKNVHRAVPCVVDLMAIQNGLSQAAFVPYVEE